MIIIIIITFFGASFFGSLALRRRRVLKRHWMVVIRCRVENEFKSQYVSIDDDAPVKQAAAEIARRLGGVTEYSLYVDNVEYGRTLLDVNKTPRQLGIIQFQDVTAVDKWPVDSPRDGGGGAMRRHMIYL